MLNTHATPVLDTCATPFSLDSNGAKLFWPFGTGSWQNRQGWLNGNESPGNGYGWGQGGHTGSDYYALDWNNLNVPDCDSPFYAPLSGKVIRVYTACAHNCIGGVPCGSYGNEVVIQSDWDTTYFFRVGHLNTVMVYVGKLLQRGDLVGAIGSTGNSTGPHAHCALYRNTDVFLTGINIGGGPDNHATKFEFSATCEANIITGIPYINNDKTISIYPNPVGNKLYVKIENPFDKKLYWNLYNNNGTLLKSGVLLSDKTIDVSFLPKGLYLLSFRSNSFSSSKKLMLQ